MQFRGALVLGLAGSAAAQSLVEALTSQNSSLSVLNGLVNSTQGLGEELSRLTNVTLLAPSNAALEKALSDPATAAALNGPGVLQAILSYHVLNGTYYASNFTSMMDLPMFIPTRLMAPGYSYVEGGQRVEVMARGDNVTAYSGLKQASNFVTTNVNFTGGTIHIIDSLLVIPENVTSTLPAFNLTAAAGAIKTAGINATIDTLQNLTIFAPSNDAFNAVGSVFANMSVEELTKGLQYHAFRGLGYSSGLMNETVMSLDGMSLNITVIDGTVFVNDAKVTVPDILVANGVVHIIDQVLNPNATDSKPELNPTTTMPAYTGASTAAGGIPFTSGITAPTSLPPGATSYPTATSHSGPAMPIKTGAMGAAALFGGAALVMNL